VVSSLFWPAIEADAPHSKSDALDVEENEEYQAMVRQIHDSELDKVGIIVDSKSVKDRCPVVSCHVCSR
jgi:hypothetical protein